MHTCRSKDQRQVTKVNQSRLKTARDINKHYQSKIRSVYTRLSEVTSSYFNDYSDLKVIIYMYMYMYEYVNYLRTALI